MSELILILMDEGFSQRYLLEQQRDEAKRSAQKEVPFSSSNHTKFLLTRSCQRQNVSLPWYFDGIRVGKQDMKHHSSSNTTNTINDIASTRLDLWERIRVFTPHSARFKVQSSKSEIKTSSCSYLAPMQSLIRIYMHLCLYFKWVCTKFQLTALTLTEPELL